MIDFITAGQAAEILGVSKKMLPRLPLPIHRPTGKRAQYRRDEVEQLLAEFRVARERAALDLVD
jgi:hypothetical protein